MGTGRGMDTTMDELLEVENAGWRSLCDGTGDAFYGQLMIDDAIMVLANGMAMNRSQVVESLAQAPPWDDYRIDEPMIIEISDTVVSLVYTGTGRRSSGDDFTGRMASTYVRREDRWRLALYQQTPTS